MRSFIALCAVIVAVALSWSVYKVAAVPAPAETLVKWEYGELSVSQGAYLMNGEVFQPKPKAANEQPNAAQPKKGIPGVLSRKDVFHWATLESDVEAESWKDLAEKLKAPEIKNNTSITQRLRVFGKLGSEGWELVTSSGSGSWMFKRRVR